MMTEGLPPTIRLTVETARPVRTSDAANLLRDIENGFGHYQRNVEPNLQTYELRLTYVVSEVYWLI